MKTARPDLLAALALQPGTFGPAEAEAVARIPRDFPGDFVGHLQSLINSGEARVWNLCTPESTQPVGWIVATIEADTAEFVILAAYGRDGRDLTVSFLPIIEQLASAEDCACVRFHTARPGLVKKALPLGYLVSEIVLRRRLS